MATFDPVEASGYGAFIEAAYDAYAPDATDSDPLRPIVPLPAGWTTAAWVTMQDFPPIGAPVERFYGYVATEDRGPGVVLAIRGTVGWMEWYDDFIVTFQPFKSGAKPYGQVSTGFARIYSTLRVYDVKTPAAAVNAGEAYFIDKSRPTQTPTPSFSAAVAKVIADRRPRGASEAVAPTFVVGHSLGAALVTLYALENAVEQHLGQAIVYTFASPRVGDADFVAAYNRWVPTTWRIVNAADIVPKAPFELMGYAHVNELIPFDSTGRVKTSPACAHAMSTYRYLLDGTTDRGTCAPAAADEVLLATVSSVPVATDPRVGLTKPASTVQLSDLSPAAVADARATVATSSAMRAVPTARLMALNSAQGKPTALDYERIMHIQNDLLDLNWFDRGTMAAKSVGRVILRDDSQREVGFATGFLVAPGVLLTNNHVLGDADAAATALVEFDYEFDVAGNPRPTARFALAPDRFFFTSPSDDFDFSLVAVADLDPATERSIAEFAWLRLNPNTGKINVGEMVTIIQHPSGLPKEVAARENQLLKIADKTLLYATDTAPGSSGSPVFNDSWQVVALHHSGVPATDAAGRWLGPDGNPAPPNPSDAQVKWLGNEGIRVSQIVSCLTSQPPHPVRDLVLAIANGQAPATTTGTKPQAALVSAGTLLPPHANGTPTPQQDQPLRVPTFHDESVVRRLPDGGIEVAVSIRGLS
jgi:V8-like Glu-specific endopeptidase